MKKTITIILIFIFSITSSFCHNSKIKLLQAEYREGPTCDLTGIYLSLHPKSECIDLDTIPRKESNQYTINFMWINKNYSEDQKYILPNEHNRLKAERYLDNIINWASKTNDDTIIQIWYDSETTSLEAIAQTEEYFLLGSVPKI